ncbi:MAG: hypothetical protein HFK10_04005 [Clostridia bacterium]|nr:hypothetical protein [Clostridia bacterium]
MKQDQKERKSFWVLLGGVCAGFAVLVSALTVGFVFAADRNTAAAQRIEDGYVAQLWELRDNLNDMENVSAKLMVAGGKTDTVMYACDLKRGAEASCNALSKLPVTGEPIGLLNKISDYASSMIRTAVSGRSTDDFTMSAENVYISVRMLNSAVEDILDDVANGRRVSDGIELGFTAGGEKQDNSVEYPELIYDGPFSDARKDKCYHGLEQLGAITEDEAKLKFAELFSLENVHVLGMSSLPEAYEMEGMLGQASVYASMSVQGGMILNLLVAKTPGAVHLSEKESERLAIDYAERLGYHDLVPVWYNADAGVAYVNLAPVSGDAILYTDLVKVKVALDDGTIMGLEAMGYCTNHHDRDYKPRMSAAAAKSLVSPRLSVSSVRLCVVPDGSAEVLCYEVAGSYKGLDYFVYLSADDGREVNILRVVDDNQGRLTV